VCATNGIAIFVGDMSKVTVSGGLVFAYGKTITSYGNVILKEYCIFAAAVKETLSSILKMPVAYPLRYRNILIAHTKVFPYNIHFYIDESKT